MSFPCVICNKPNRSKNPKIKKYKLCSECYMEITRGHERHRPEKAKHTKCQICNADINHSNKHSVCNFGKCRGLLYRKMKSIKQIEEAIKNNDYSKIMGFNLKEIINNGFQINITVATRCDA